MSTAADRQHAEDRDEIPPGGTASSIRRSSLNAAEVEVRAGQTVTRGGAAAEPVSEALVRALATV